MRLSPARRLGEEQRVLESAHVFYCKGKLNGSKQELGGRLNHKNLIRTSSILMNGQNEKEKQHKAQKEKKGDIDKIPCESPHSSLLLTKPNVGVKNASLSLFVEKREVSR